MKKLLYEVSIIRPLVIFLLIFMHSFTVYTGAWPEFTCFEGNQLYFWMCKFITGFRIETIAIVAGYVFSYQSNTLHRTYEFIPFAKKKFSRLYIQCLFFGIFYYLIFLNTDTFNISSFIIQVTSGAGHLWFLPMLFWCFLFIWAIDKYKPNKYLMFVILSLLSVLPIPWLPFGLQRSFHFIFYVYAGYLLWIYKSFIIERNKIRTILILCTLYVILVIAKTQIEIYLPIKEKTIITILSNTLHYFTSITGIMSMYLVVCRFTEKPNYIPSKFILNLSGICYGMYVFHQFILKFLLYNTSLPCILGQGTPWVCFVITVFISYLLTKLFMNFKFGRLLIG